MIFLTINSYSIGTNTNYKSPKIMITSLMISSFLYIKTFSLSLVSNFPFIFYFFTFLFSKKIATINILFITVNGNFNVIYINNIDTTGRRNNKFTTNSINIKYLKCFKYSFKSNIKIICSKMCFT